MFSCSHCNQKNNLIVCSKCNTIVCSSCHKNGVCSICENDIFYRINKEKIEDHDVDFIALKRFSIGFFGFDRIDKSLMDIINSINQIDESTEKSKIILFPNKIESVRFAQKFDPDIFRDEEEIVKKSKYSYLITPGNTFYLLNFENVKSNEISFLIKLLILEQANPDVETEYRRYKKILFDSLKIYNERFAIDNVSFTSFDEHGVRVVFQNCYKYFQSYTAYKKLIKEYFLDLFNYLQYKIELDFSRFQQDEFFNTASLYDLYMHVLGLKLIEKSVKENNIIHDALTKKIDEKIENYFSIFKNDELRSVFNIFISDIEKQDHLDEYEFYIHFIKSSLNKIFRSVPLIFLRYSEIIGLSIEAHDLINQTQSMMIEYRGIKIVPNISELFEFIIKLNRILSVEIPLQYRLILLYTKFDLLNEIIVRSRDKTFFDLLVETHNEFERLLLQNYKQLKKDKSFAVEYCDILLHYGSIALIYYLLHDIKNTLLVFKKRRQYLDLYPVPDYLKICMLFTDFQFFEDYAELKEIHKICLNYSPDENNDFHDMMIKGICEFSCFFSEKKGDLLEILNFIKDQVIIPQPIVKNIIEKEASEIFIGVFYHIINATKQESTILLISEVEKALELAKLQYELNEELYPYDYYLLKTQAIIEILNENLSEVKNIVLKLDSYDLKSKNSFKTAIIYWLESTEEIYGKNIDILTKLKDVDDPWCNLIYKIIKEKIRQSSYTKAKSELEEVRKLKNVDEQLIRFKEIVERNCVKAFWESRIKGILKPQPEEIGKSQLVTFLDGTEFYSYIGTENEEGVGKCDILTLSKKNEKNIFELKIVKSETDIKKGIKELLYYISKENLKNGYLILFDIRKRKYKTKKMVIKDNKKINILSMKINETAPSK